jgi:hypothetical protein
MPHSKMPNPPAQLDCNLAFHFNGTVVISGMKSPQFVVNKKGERVAALIPIAEYEELLRFRQLSVPSADSPAKTKAKLAFAKEMRTAFREVQDIVDGKTNGIPLEQLLREL